MITMPSYVGKLVGLRVLAALGVLVGILQVLDLMDITADILDRGLGMSGVVYYASLRMPRLILQAAPLAVLAGSLFAFTQLARESAVIAMRAAGMSAYRIAAMAAPAIVAMMVLELILGIWVAPHTDEVTNEWWRASTPPAKVKVVGPQTFRLGPDIVVATPGDEAGERLKNVSIYRRDANGRLVQSTHAPTAAYTPNGWRLDSPTFETPGVIDVARSAAATMIWTTRLRPHDVQALFSNNQVLTHASASRALKGGASIRGQSFYRTQLYRTWAVPFGAVVMLLLAAPAALANFRAGGAGMLAICLGTGLLFLVCDGMFTAIGESGLAPAFIAAWSAPLIFGAVGLTALVYLEG